MHEDQTGTYKSNHKIMVLGDSIQIPGKLVPGLVKQNYKCHRQRHDVSTPFYSLLVHSLFIPSHSSPSLPLLLPLTAFIPTPFTNLHEVPQPSHDNRILCTVLLSSLIPPLSISVSRSLLDRSTCLQLILDTWFTFQPPLGLDLLQFSMRSLPSSLFYQLLFVSVSCSRSPRFCIYMDL